MSQVHQNQGEVRVAVPPKRIPAFHSAEVKAQCRKLFFEHYSVPQIARQMGIGEANINRWAYGNASTKPENTWSYQRKQREKELCDTIVEDNIYHIQKLMRVSLPLLTDGVTARARSHYGDDQKGVKAKPLTMKEMKDLTEIISQLDKLFRLDTRKPTELFGFVPVSLDQLKDAIKKDLFLDVTPTGQMALPNSKEMKNAIPFPDEPEWIEQPTGGPELPDDGSGDDSEGM